MNRDKLRAVCEQCFGLCCVALRFSVTEGFPIDKEVGHPCLHLQPDFRCGIHTSLNKRGLKGCVTFECFGAGQYVSQVSFGGLDWREYPDSAAHMFKTFIVIMQLHELLWYLAEALRLEAASPIYKDLRFLFEETERLTYLNPKALLDLDVPAHRESVNALLLKTSALVRSEALNRWKNRLGLKRRSSRQKTIGGRADWIGTDLRKMDLRAADLRGAYLIAADLRGMDLRGTDFIGADFRDADIRGADLSESIFVTQAQLNAAKGDAQTQLPSSLSRPGHWDVETRF